MSSQQNSITIRQKVILLCLGFGEQTESIRIFVLAFRTNVDVEDFVEGEIDILSTADLTFWVFPLIQRKKVVTKEALFLHCIQSLLL